MLSKLQNGLPYHQLYMQDKAKGVIDICKLHYYDTSKVQQQANAIAAIPSCRNPRGGMWSVVYCGLRIAAAAIRKLNYIPHGLRQLAHCGSAAKGDDVP